MTKYLITSSLLNSYNYYIQDEWKSPADSRADFLKTLSREKFEPNEAMQRGIDFEDDIRHACENGLEVFNLVSVDECAGDLIEPNTGEPYVEHNQRNKIILDLVDIVKGGLWQQTCKKDLQVGNNTFLLYGRMDVVKRDTVYDIKFTSNYELGKFLDSSQHLIYLYCTELPNFKYLVSDGKDYWVENYFNGLEIEDKIRSKIADFMSYLDNDLEAKEIFLTKWESK